MENKECGNKRPCYFCFITTLNAVVIISFFTTILIIYSNIITSIKHNLIHTSTAKELLGMQRLTNKQTVYISIPKKDYVEHRAEEVIIEELKIGIGIGNIFEYKVANETILEDKIYNYGCGNVILEKLIFSSELSNIFLSNPSDPPITKTR